ncbi:MAG: LysM peptidoglycan-binding domain-containing protein [Chlamydia sp.]
MNITRRDTIIIATLCNVFVLICIIATAKVAKSSSIQSEVQPALARAIVEAVPESPRISHPTSPDEVALLFQPKERDIAPFQDEETNSFDEIDQLLEEYERPIPATKKSELIQKKEPKVAAVENKNREKKPGIQPQKPFVADHSTPLKKTKPTSSIGSNRRVYIVQSGDNPWTIAKKCKISVETLLLLNKLDEIKAKNLKIGQVLIIEGGGDREDDDLNSQKTQEQRFKASPR